MPQSPNTSVGGSANMVFATRVFVMAQLYSITARSHHHEAQHPRLQYPKRPANVCYNRDSLSEVTRTSGCSAPALDTQKHRLKHSSSRVPKLSDASPTTHTLRALIVPFLLLCDLIVTWRLQTRVPAARRIYLFILQDSIEPSIRFSSLRNHNLPFASV